MSYPRPHEPTIPAPAEGGAVRDALLLRRIAAHDAQALAELYASWSGPLYSYALRVLPAPEDAEDALPVRTSEGVRVADVGWMSRERWAPQRRATALECAPKICVEILSPSNCREEMLEKMTLYYAKGAEEVWLCDEAGHMEFFTARSAPLPVTVSVLCPDFPRQIDVD